MGGWGGPSRPGGDGPCVCKPMAPKSAPKAARPSPDRTLWPAAFCNDCRSEGFLSSTEPKSNINDH